MTPDPEYLQKVSSWIQKARAGDESAFEALVRLYYGRLFEVLRHILPTREDVEEVLQEGFYRFYLALPRLRDGADPYPFLRTTCLRRAYSFLKKNRVRPESLDDLEEGGAVFVSRGVSPDPNRLRRWAVRLPPKRRIVFLLRELAGMSDEEIAGRLGIKRTTVRRHAQLALDELQRTLEEGDF